MVRVCQPCYDLLRQTKGGSSRFRHRHLLSNFFQLIHLMPKKYADHKSFTDVDSPKIFRGGRVCLLVPKCFGKTMTWYMYQLVHVWIDLPFAIQARWHRSQSVHTSGITTSEWWTLGDLRILITNKTPMDPSTSKEDTLAPKLYPKCIPSSKLDP